MLVLPRIHENGTESIFLDLRSSKRESHTLLDLPDLKREPSPLGQESHDFLVDFSELRAEFPQFFLE